MEVHRFFFCGVSQSGSLIRPLPPPKSRFGKKNRNFTNVRKIPWPGYAQRNENLMTPKKSNLFPTILGTPVIQKPFQTRKEVYHVLLSTVHAKFKGCGSGVFNFFQACILRWVGRVTRASNPPPCSFLLGLTLWDINLQ